MDLRQTLIVEGRLLADRGRTAERFVQWAEAAPWLARRPWLRWLCRGTAAIELLIPPLAIGGLIPFETGMYVVCAVLLLNLNVIALFGGKVYGIFDVLNLRHGEAARYLRMFELMYAMPDASGELDALKREATDLGGGVLLRMRQLNRIAVLAMLRHNSFLKLFLYVPVQFAFLYDFHVLDLLEAWQAKYGEFARAGSRRWGSSRLSARWPRWSAIIPAGRCPRLTPRPSVCRPGSLAIRSCPATPACPTTSRSVRPARSCS